jgi:hypothetical protein
MDTNTTPTKQAPRAVALHRAAYDEARKGVIYYRKAWAAATEATEQAYFFDKHTEMAERVAALVSIARHSGIELS